MKKLLTYQEYRDLAVDTPVEKEIFDKRIKKAVLKFNYLTNNRIYKFPVIPDEVKITLCEFVNIIDKFDVDGVIGLTSYSNGIESFGYANADNPEKSLNSVLWEKCKENLSKYPKLIYRGF